MRRDLQDLEAGYDDESMRTRRFRFPAAALVAVVLASASSSLVACSKGDDVVATTSDGTGGAPPLGPECGDDPWSCPDGQTCWVASDDAWRCQAAGAGVVGDGCKAIIGEPACGAGLLCIGADPTTGTCSPFCSTADSGGHACSGGAACSGAKG